VFGFHKLGLGVSFKALISSSAIFSTYDLSFHHEYSPPYAKSVPQLSQITVYILISFIIIILLNYKFCNLSISAAIKAPQIDNLSISGFDII
jgi:hypothetical protein